VIFFFHLSHDNLERETGLGGGGRGGGGKGRVEEWRKGCEKTRNYREDNQRRM